MITKWPFVGFSDRPAILPEKFLPQKVAIFKTFMQQCEQIPDSIPEHVLSIEKIKTQSLYIEGSI
jgi:hypothetical protein